MPPSDDPLFRSNPFTFFKALLYEEYYADNAPFRRSLISLESIHFFKALLYEEYYADMSPSDESLVSLESIHFF